MKKYEKAEVVVIVFDDDVRTDVISTSVEQGVNWNNNWGNDWLPFN